MAKTKKASGDLVKRSKAKAVQVSRVQPREVRFHYIKSKQYRVIHVSGAHGGLTPDGRGIHIAFFSERVPISQEETYTLHPDGQLGELKEKTVRNGLVREVEASAMINLDRAKSLHAWLGKNIEKAEQIAAEREKVGQKKPKA
jgi:hypothetical protein